MRSIFFLGTAREGSTRCKNKMIRDFNGSSLFELYLDKLELLFNQGYKVGCAVYPGDKTLWERIQQSDVPVIERNKTSVTGAHPRSVELHFLEDVDADLIVWINACQPFLRVKTILDAVDQMEKMNAVSCTCVKNRYTWFWDTKSNPVNNRDPRNMATQNATPLLEATHSFHMFPRKRLLDENIMWNYAYHDPFLFRVSDDLEFFDIDTTSDFRVGECLWKNQ